MFRVRVREPNPLQKPWVSPRFRMAQSGQGRQRLKIFFPLDRTRKESLLPSAKIRSRWRSHQIFGVTALGFSSSVVCHACEGLGFPFPIPSILARLLLEQVQRFWRPCFFFSSTAGAIQTYLVVVRARSWIGCLRFFLSSTAGAIPTCAITVGARLRIHRSYVPLFFYSQLLIQAYLSPFYVYCTTSLSNKR